MKTTYKVNGMSCDGCRSHVEKALSEVDGVQKVYVSLSKAEAAVESEKPIDFDLLAGVLKGSGYELAPMAISEHLPNGKIKQSFTITGMSCEGCQAHVTEALSAVNGVDHVRVDLEQGQAVVEMNQGMGIDDLAPSLAGSGYGIEAFNPFQQKDLRKEPVKSTGTGIFYCPMRCEGEKTYDHPGSCPVCGMDLIEQPWSVFATTAAVYTCPMHPEVVQSEPGSCPICGMDLVPKMPIPKNENKTYKDLLKKFKVALLFSIPVFLISMSGMIPNNPLYQVMDLKYWNWIEFGLSLPVVFYATWMFFERAWRSLATRNLNMFTLIGMGAGVAWLFSVLALLVPSILPREFKTMDGVAHVYFEAAVVILTLVSFGQLLEARAHGKTNDAIKALMGLAPNAATKVVNGKEMTVAIQDIVKGDLLRVKPGGKIPVDGKLVEGSAVIDESMISGEPIPVEKTIGDELSAGTLNGEGTLVMKAEKVGSETLLAQIIDLVNTAGSSKAPVQKLADKISGYFVPIVVVIAVLTFIVWSIWGPEPTHVYALVNAIAVLIIACPCALGLATPMSVKVALGKGARAGVLVKDAASFEKMSKANVVVVDKTGTLTEGRPSVEKIVPISPDLSELAMLAKIVALNKNSEHPLAAAMVKEGERLGITTINEVSDFRAITGKGVTGFVNGRSILLGNQELMTDAGIVIAKEVSDAVATQQERGKTVSFLAENKMFLGYIVISDKIKEGAKEAVARLKAEGMEVWMFTGDNEKTAAFVSQSLGLDGFKAKMLPNKKWEGIRTFQETGKIVAMAGDGINDAPALSQANVGIAMGTGTDIAMKSATVTLVNGDIRGIVRAKLLSEATMRNIHQNLWWALGYNTIGIPIAAGVLFPFFGLLLSPMLAALAMSFSSVSVIANALRLRSVKID